MDSSSLIHHKKRHLPQEEEAVAEEEIMETLEPQMDVLYEPQAVENAAVIAQMPQQILAPAGQILLPIYDAGQTFVATQEAFTFQTPVAIQIQPGTILHQQ